MLLRYIFVIRIMQRNAKNKIISLRTEPEYKQSYGHPCVDFSHAHHRCTVYSCKAYLHIQLDHPARIVRAAPIIKNPIGRYHPSITLRFCIHAHTLGEHRSAISEVCRAAARHLDAALRNRGARMNLIHDVRTARQRLSLSFCARLCIYICLCKKKIKVYGVRWYVSYLKV